MWRALLFGMLLGFVALVFKGASMTFLLIGAASATLATAEFVGALVRACVRACVRDAVRGEQVDSMPTTHEKAFAVVARASVPHHALCSSTRSHDAIDSFAQSAASLLREHRCRCSACGVQFVLFCARAFVVRECVLFRASC